MWEDASLVEGCQIEIKTMKNHTSKYWEDLVLAMLGEQFAEPNFVVGMIMKLKPQFDKISIWLRDSNKTEAIAKTREEICSLLSCEDGDLEFMVFKE